MTDAEKIDGYLRRIEGNVTYEQCIERIQSGRYFARVGYHLDLVVGVLVYEIIEDTCKVIWYCVEPGFSNFFRDDFYEELKRSGIKKISAISKRSRKGFEVITGMQYQWSYYEKEL
jgi:hypothetical protein